MKKFIALWAFAALFCAGCAHTSWMPYVGAQQNWTTSPGAFADTNRSLFIYYGYPPADYVVLGKISLWSQNETGGINCAANEAKARGADAIIIGPGGSFPMNGVLFAQNAGPPGSAFGSALAAPMVQHDLTAVAIKWKNPTGHPAFNAPKHSTPSPNHRGQVALNHR